MSNDCDTDRCLDRRSRLRAESLVKDVEDPPQAHEGRHGEREKSSCRAAPNVGLLGSNRFLLCTHLVGLRHWRRYD